MSSSGLVPARRIPSARWISQDVTSSAGWQVVLQSRRGGVVVLYNRSSRALAIEAPLPGHSVTSEDVVLEEESEPAADAICPLCKQTLPQARGRAAFSGFGSSSRPLLTADTSHAHEMLSQDYFQLLGQSHQGSPTATPESSRPGTPVFAEIGRHLEASSFLDGYYSRFFVEIAKLGRGMTGSVHLCQHVLNGNPLGYFACKKIPVSNSSPSLAKALKEIKHLESLRHANIVAIHHVWLETAALSRGPPVPCLFALMDYANAGSLDKFIQARGGLQAMEDGQPLSADERKARARQRRSRSPNGQDVRAVHFLSLPELLSLATDIASGLAFLHEHNMLHLDLKAENILLKRSEEDGTLFPTALLSDFGSAEARNAVNNRKQRSGFTGTLDYLAPESFSTLPNGRARPHSTQLDLWALGLILYLLAFFELPYKEIEVDALTREIQLYPGYSRQTCPHKRRDLPTAFLDILESLLHIDSNRRISAQAVLLLLAQMGTESVSTSFSNTAQLSTSTTLVRRIGSAQAIIPASMLPFKSKPAWEASPALPDARIVPPVLHFLLRVIFVAYLPRLRRLELPSGLAEVSVSLISVFLLVTLALLETTYGCAQKISWSITAATVVCMLLRG